MVQAPMGVAKTRSTHEMELLANAVRSDVIRMLTAAGSGHPGGSLSCVEMLVALYFSGVMRYDANDPNDPTRDRFVLSKGHAAPTYYGVAHQLGWLREEDILALRKLGSRLQGHIDSRRCPGVEVCSGSLGQGLSVACGMALSFKWSAAPAEEPRRVFCVCGDGEMQEGSNWESLMFAAHQGLSNLTMLLDLNRLQIDGPVSDVNSLGDIDAKLAAFGWHVRRVNGHDLDALTGALKEAVADSGAPSAIVCETVKGRGISFMEDELGWHGVAPSAEQGAQALAELEAQRKALVAREEACA